MADKKLDNVIAPTNLCKQMETGTKSAFAFAGV